MWSDGISTIKLLLIRTHLKLQRISIKCVFIYQTFLEIIFSNFQNKLNTQKSISADRLRVLKSSGELYGNTFIRMLYVQYTQAQVCDDIVIIVIPKKSYCILS